MADNGIERAVIVESGFGESDLLPLPVGRELLIEHLLSTLSRHGIREAAIITGENNARVADLDMHRGPEREIKVLWKIAPFYCGTAGSLKLVDEFLSGPQFVVVHCNLYLMGLDLAQVIRDHHQSRAGVTFVAYGDEGGDDLENIEIDQCGLIRQINTLHSSRNRRRRINPYGMYVMNREVLDMIPSGGYFDIKEQLVPAVRARGISVRAHVVNQPAYAIKKLEDLLELNKRILLGDDTNHTEHDRWSTETDHIVIGENARISPTSYLLGPLVIGPNSVVEDHVQLIGPAVLGTSTILEKGSIVRESIVWSGARVLSNARVEHSFIPGDAIVPEGIRLRREHQTKLGSSHSMINGHSHTSARLIPWALNVWKPASKHRDVKITYHLIKRAMDVGLSLILFLASVPLLLLIAVAIKLDAPGPILFAQRRCGKGGKEFRMLKFRTMVPDAEKRQDDLRDHNLVDGPMFKLDEDPRITRVGKFLRKTSLDELPQLVNVLRGEMSLVGPRPLAYPEMKFCPSWRDLRLTVTPGVTGLWQVRSRDHNRFSDWIRYDIEYVQTQSLSMDLWILFRTIKVLLKGV